ncbi:hypothetical protein KY360_07515 [Candidatus Woesearchaeota archaeon]|nr:hypothetical protein [Candidatus Woesearchaeota archaeon]
MINILKNIEFGRLLDNFTRLKNCVSEWIVSIDTKQYELHKDLKELQFKISELEGELKQLRFQNGR